MRIDPMWPHRKNRNLFASEDEPRVPETQKEKGPGEEKQFLHSNERERSGFCTQKNEREREMRFESIK